MTSTASACPVRCEHTAPYDGAWGKPPVVPHVVAVGPSTCSNTDSTPQKHPAPNVAVSMVRVCLDAGSANHPAGRLSFTCPVAYAGGQTTTLTRGACHCQITAAARLFWPSWLGAVEKSTPPPLGRLPFARS